MLKDAELKRNKAAVIYLIPIKHISGVHVIWLEFILTKDLPSQMPKISVIIPAYRPVDFKALRKSIEGNANTNVEWVVVDDGSGQDFQKVFTDLQVDGVQLITLARNRGQAAARNVGLAKAKGHWVKFLDADDCLDIGHLSALKKAAEATAPNVIPFAPTKHVFANESTSVNESWRDLQLDSNAQFRRLLVRPFLHHCGALFLREQLVGLDGYDETLQTDEDGDLLIRVLMGGAHFIAVEEVNYHYIHNDDRSRVSSDDDIYKLNARLRVCEKVEAAYSGAAGPMPYDISLALAQRLDKIAMNYWISHRQESREVFRKARVVNSDYTPDMRGSLRLLRRLGGPSAVFAATTMYRRLKGLPDGGAQG